MNEQDSRATSGENLSATGEAAIEKKVQRAKLAALNEAYSLAANDPAFRADTNAVTYDFAATDRDGL